MYTGTSSTVALNSNVRSAVLANSCASVKVVLPSLTKTLTFCTGLASVPAFDPFNVIAFVPTLLPVGSVAPVADIDNDPEWMNFLQ